MSIPSLRARPGSLWQRVAALLALCAMVGMLSLATWHDGMPHDHAPVHAASVDLDHHEHAPSNQPDPADIMHQAAQAVTQSVDVPSQPLLASTMLPVAIRWRVAPPGAGGAIRPQALLRPPRR